ncbi:heme biosynthesis protein HemY [Cognatishimia sp. F0-27]|uniref:heme biosynthesis protein HemY n=1 Tax=Cognatishimia sp. F0-27 TaxID=2816855 RepID=UPI001D0C598D|nr:heme biosynthesis HemY N-terminal domain-containing protein [Cognatishimia sp. F0-27]MCC1491210.1 tetratricopeptide repeat protein [Cognatishimia sp. F0-27]
MLWSLLKIIVFVALVAALSLGAGYLSESSGGVQLTVAGTEYTLGPLQSVIAAAALVVILYVFFKIAGLTVAVLRWINGDETAISRYFDRNRERKGYQALSEGLMALASGEGRLAMAKANKAEKYLHKPELTDLINAQAAEMVGDKRKAEEVYKRLLQRDETRFVGIRGIMKQKLNAGDTDTALKLAERAFAIKPRHEEVQDTLLRLQAESSDYEGARKTLAAKLKHGALPRDVYKRRDAVLALSEMRDASDSAPGAMTTRAEIAIKANKAAPDLVPAAALAARSFVAQDRKRNAVRVLKKAWQEQPHPDLAAAFADIEPNETPADRVKRFTALTTIHPEHRETRLLLAELNIAAENFPEARRAVSGMVEDDPDARLLAIMAAIEKGEGGSDEVVRGWLARALTAPRGPQWICGNCNAIHTQWEPLCENCGAFDTMEWKTPSQSESVLQSGADMLPLLVGSPADPALSDARDISNADAVNAAEARDIAGMSEDKDAKAKPVAEDAVVVEDAEPAEARAK